MVFKIILTLPEITCRQNDIEETDRSEWEFSVEGGKILL